MPYKIEDGITQTILSSFMSCPMKCSYLLKGLYDPTKEGNYTRGTIGHEFLDILYTQYANQNLAPTNTQIDKIIDEYYEKYSATVDEEKLNKIFGTLEALIKSYIKFYAADFKNKKYECEETFDVSWNGFRLRGKPDIRFMEKKDACIMEHKFWSQIPEDKIAYTLSLDFQSNFYAFIHKVKTGKFPKKILYNVIRVPQNKPKDAETSKAFAARLLEVIKENPKYYFIRTPVVLSEKMCQRFEAQIGIKLLNFKSFLSMLTPVMNETACVVGPFLCEYAQICTSFSEAGFKKKELFSELKKEEK